MAMWRMRHKYLWHRRPAPAQTRFHGVWSISYADLMTLLVCFFVVILAASPPPAAKGAKAHSVMASLRSAFGTSGDGERGAEPKKRTLVEQLAAMTEAGEDGPPGAGQKRAVSLTHGRDGLCITLRGDAAFAADTTTGVRLTTDAERTLLEMAAGLAQFSARAEIRVYADPAGMSGKMGPRTAATPAAKDFDGGLAHARAVAGVLSQCGLPIDRLQLVAARDAGVESSAHGRLDPGRAPGAHRFIPAGQATRMDTGRVDVIVRAAAE